MSKYVFFIQLEPDIDHSTPLAYQLNKAEPGSVTILCVNAMYDVYTDYRLQFLKENGVSIKYLHHISILRHLEFFISNFITRLPKFVVKLVPVKYWPRIYSDIRRIHKPSLEKFFKGQGTRVVTIDEGQPLVTMNPILTVAKEMGIKSVKLTTANPMRIYAKGIETSKESKMFDYHIRPQDITPYGPCSSENPKELVLGCMRYCNDWQKIHTKLLKKFDGVLDLPQSKENLKILIFERSTKGFLIDHPVVKKIKQLSDVDVVFRGRPRILLPKKLYDESVNSLPSAHLIQWADVVICSISSICLDVLHYKKTLLYPKFVAPDEDSSFEVDNVCWKVEDENELLNAIEVIKKDRETRPYHEDEVEKYFEKIIYCHDREKDILGGYKDFYQSLT